MQQHVLSFNRLGDHNESCDEVCSVISNYGTQSEKLRHHQIFVIEESTQNEQTQLIKLLCEQVTDDWLWMMCCKITDMGCDETAQEKVSYE